MSLIYKSGSRQMEPARRLPLGANRLCSAAERGRGAAGGVPTSGEKGTNEAGGDTQLGETPQGVGGRRKAPRGGRTEEEGGDGACRAAAMSCAEIRGPRGAQISPRRWRLRRQR